MSDTMRAMKKRASTMVMMFVIFTTAACEAQTARGLPPQKKNVLFVVVDDLRPMMHRAYNFSLGVTPELDKLSEEGLTFTRAYCNYAFCSPSLSGLVYRSFKTP